MINIYITMIISLFIGTFLCTFKINDKFKNLLFFGCFLFISTILIFRYGQGTDYFAYMYIYNGVGKATSISAISLLGLHGEVLWKILNYLFIQMNLSFETFVFVLSIIFSGSLYFYINTYVHKSKMLALALSFHYIYLVYFMSALRQGLVLSVFITILLRLYEGKKFKLFIFITLLCTGIHKSALLFLVMPFIPYIKKNQWIYLYIGSVFLSIVLSIYDGINLFNLIQVSFLQLMERVLFLIVIIYLYRNSSKEQKENHENLYKIYIIGFLVYIIFIHNHLLCSRLSVYFRIIELVLIPNLLEKGKISLINKMIIHYGLAILVSLLSLKSINTSIDQGEYYSKKIMDYPYVSIFNKNDIYRYRDSRFYSIE